MKMKNARLQLMEKWSGRENKFSGGNRLTVAGSGDKKFSPRFHGDHKRVFLSPRMFMYGLELINSYTTKASSVHIFE